MRDWAEGPSDSFGEIKGVKRCCLEILGSPAYQCAFKFQGVKDPPQNLDFEFQTEWMFQVINMEDLPEVIDYIVVTAYWFLLQQKYVHLSKVFNCQLTRICMETDIISFIPLGCCRVQHILTYSPCSWVYKFYSDSYFGLQKFFWK